MDWKDKLARQPGGDGPKVIEISGDFIAAMLALEDLSIFSARTPADAPAKPDPKSRKARR